jgi:beta-glucosidase
MLNLNFITNRTLAFMKRLTFILYLMMTMTQLAQNNNCNDKPWLDTSLSFEQRASLLIDCMTLEEKASQLLNESPAINNLGIEQYNWWSEALHGVARSAKATVFPQAIGMAATFDTKLMHQVGTIISDEARAINNHLVASNGKYIQYMGLTFWSPNVNIFRDPRWGRGQETYGEDPFLSGSMGAAFIRGMQGDHPKYLKTAACAKHFVVHSGPEAVRNSFNAITSLKDLHETYLPAFKLCVDAGVEAVMCAYNRTNDEACCGSNTLLNDILRNEWNFKGHIVSDCGAIKNFHEQHNLTKSPAESAALAIISGVDVNCGDTYEHLIEAVEIGLLTEKEIDERLATLLMTRFKLGMFDPHEENPYTSIPTTVINSSDHKNIAKQVAQKSIVLLQNKNSLLPLKNDLPFIYLGGPLAADVRSLLGNYHGLSSSMVTLVEGVASKTSPSTRVQFNSGSLLSTENKNPMDWYSGTAGAADVTITAVGFTSLLEGEEGESIASEYKGDNVTMKLPVNQLIYLRKIAEKDKPLVVVVFAGCPVDLTEISELADAILYAWYPGEEGGSALADIIFGDVSPSGKLPITFPKSVDQLPPYEDYSMAGRTYKYMEESPMYPFGYGKSYASFRLENLVVEKRDDANNNEYSVSVTLSNTGQIKAEEVVQLYVSLLDVEETVPKAELKAFKRVEVLGGKSEMVNFSLSPYMFSYINKYGDSVEYKGKVKITIGNSSPGARSLELGAAIVSKEITL